MKLSCFAVALCLALPLFAADDASKGKAIFQEQCVVCHNANSEERKTGPGLKNLYKHPKLGSGKKPSDQSVLELITAGRNAMPAYADSLTEAERKQVVAYLRTL